MPLLWIERRMTTSGIPGMQSPFLDGHPALEAPGYFQMSLAGLERRSSSSVAGSIFPPEMIATFSFVFGN